MPPLITGSVAAVLGFSLGYTALDMTSGNCCGANGAEAWWLTALVTLMATILFFVYLQNYGFNGMLPILLGAIVGYLVAIPLELVDFLRLQAQNSMFHHL